MRIEIEIPKEFECDYNGDKFKDFFSRVLCDIEKGKCLCGSYEIETVEMLIKAFNESKPAYDVKKVFAELEEIGTKEAKQYLTKPRGNGKSFTVGYIKGFEKAMEIVRNGGKE